MGRSIIPCSVANNGQIQEIYRPNLFLEHICIKIRRILRDIRAKFYVFFYSFHANIRIGIHPIYHLTKFKSTIRAALNFIVMLVIPAESESQEKFQE